MKKIKNNNFSTKIIKILKFLLFLLAIMYVGVIIGYSIIGNGKLIDILDFSAIKHIIDIIYN